MAKTVDQIVQEQIGSLVLQNAKLQADLGIAMERIAELEKAADPKK